MSDHRRDSLIPHPSVTIEAAAELTDVDLRTVRGWAGQGALVIEQRGDMEVVRLDEVKALAARRRGSRQKALRDRLADRDMAPTSTVANIADLQGLARERSE